jgi:acetyl-CoA C-acetyltransferase
MSAGVPQEKTAWALNQLCGSGLRTVAIGMQQIANGDASVIVAGGQESMSLAPHAAHMRNGTKMGDFKLVDTMLKDGLMDAFNGYHMGNTAENVAQRWQLTREEQDQFAAASRTRSSRSRSRPARATWWSTRTSTSAPERPSRPWPSCGPPSRRRAR